MSLPIGSMALSTVNENKNPTGTVLSLLDEIKFRNWVAQNHIQDADSSLAHYDYRGYWKAQQAGDVYAQQAANHHFPDTYKLPGHPTFSNESDYASSGAPQWTDDDKLVSPTQGLIANEGTVLPSRKSLFRL